MLEDIEAPSIEVGTRKERELLKAEAGWNGEGQIAASISEREEQTECESRLRNRCGLWTCVVLERRDKKRVLTS